MLASAGLAAAQAPEAGSAPAAKSPYGASAPTSGSLFPANYLPESAPPPPAPLAPARPEPAPGPKPTTCSVLSEDCTCGPRFWVSGEYLLWWLKDAPLTVPLVTTGDPTDPVAPGALGRPGTTTLFGPGTYNYPPFSGGRLTAGAWLDSGRRFGLEGSAFLLEQRSAGFNLAGDSLGNPPIYMPVFRADLGMEGAFTISDPAAVLTGSVATASSTQLWGAEANGLVNLTRRNGLSIDMLAGFRYLDLRESLTIDVNAFDPVNVINDVIHDQFLTHNQFYGGQLGAKVGLVFNRATVDLAAKVALGTNHQVVDTNGSTTEFGVGSANPGTFPGGVFTQPTNIGRQTRDEFSVIPEVQVKVGYRISAGLSAFVGYEFLYWNQVVRPGDEIDRNVNPTQTLGGTLAGPAVPAPQFNRTDFWAHGLSFGLELRY
jgi:hypothetical protein